MNLGAALGQDVASVERRPAPYATSHRLEELDVLLVDGSRLRLMHKDLRREHLAPAALHAKPVFLHDPRREREAYALLSGRELGTPILHAEGEGWLLLENVAGTPLSETGELATWCLASDWLRRLHMAFADAAPESDSLLRYDADYFMTWPRRARMFVGAGLDRVLAGYEEVVERLVALPPTLIHGEFYASNVLVAGSRVAPVDWEMAGVGPGLIDLAALTSGSWSEEDRRAIEDSYGPFDDEALDCCRLHVALQWLGWTERWSPPAAHAHDWLRSATEVRERLEL